MSTENLASDLMQFTGTCHYYRWSVMYPKCLLTDGTKYLAETAGAYWLMDVVASYLGKYGDVFGVATLKRKNGDAFTFTLDDGNGNVHATQEIEFSDFPLDSIKLYVCWDTQNWTLMLTSEY